jgi:DNA-3-methyladenine glycosylase II
MSDALLESQSALESALSALYRADPELARLLAGEGPPALRRHEPGLRGLLRIIVSQQVSTASAAAIWARVEGVFPHLTPEAIAAASDADLRLAGLSGAKVRAWRAVAEAVGGRGLVLDELGRLGAEEAHARLVALKGVGPWTADVYLLFCLGHADAFPAGDIALQEAARLAFNLPARPAGPDLVALAERWRPWRGAAAHVLWAYYRRCKSRDGAPA